MSSTKENARRPEKEDPVAPYSNDLDIETVYRFWHSRQEGFTRKSMEPRTYTHMMARLHKAGKRRTNCAVSVKGGLDEYKKARRRYMKTYWKRVLHPNV